MVCQRALPPAQQGSEGAPVSPRAASGRINMSATPPKEVEAEAESPDNDQMDRNEGAQEQGAFDFDIKEQDRWLPIANGASASHAPPAVPSFPLIRALSYLLHVDECRARPLLQSSAKPSTLVLAACPLSTVLFRPGESARCPGPLTPAELPKRLPKHVLSCSRPRPQFS